MWIFCCQKALESIQNVQHKFFNIVLTPPPPHSPFPFQQCKKTAILEWEGFPKDWRGQHSQFLQCFRWMWKVNHPTCSITQFLRSCRQTLPDQSADLPWTCYQVNVPRSNLKTHSVLSSNGTEGLKLFSLYWRIWQTCVFSHLCSCTWTPASCSE